MGTLIRGVLACGLVLGGCGGSSGGTGGGDGGGGGGGGGTGRWSRTEVGVGSRASLSVAADGTRDLVFLRSTGSDTAMLIHAEQPGGTGAYVETEIEAVAMPSGGQDLLRPRVARDAAGTVYVAYQSGEVDAEPPPQVKLAIRTAGTFTTELIADAAFAPVLAVGTDGPRVAYLRDVSSRRLPTYATRAGGTWQAHDVFTSNDASLLDTIGLALGPDDTPHVLWVNQAQSRLVWSTWTGAGFATEVAGDAPTRLSGIELRAMFTPDGAPYALHGGDHVSLKAWTKVDGTWAPAAAGAASPEGRWGAAFQPSGQLLVLASGEDQWIGTGEFIYYTEEQVAQLLAQECETSDLATTSAGDPVAVLDCDSSGGRAIVVMERVGTYSSAWESACEDAAEAICAVGCGCDTAECCIGTFCTSAFGCVGNTRARLCGDPTIDEAAVLACAPVAEQGMCVDVVAPGQTGRYELPPACQITRPE